MRSCSIFFVELLAACGDNLTAPDLALVPAQMDGTVLVTDTAFAADDCEVVEQCVDAPGTRRLLRFATVTENVGDVALDLGPTPPAGEDGGIFVWSPCHMHHHVAGYADYVLRDATGIVVHGRKQAFCLEDDAQVEPRGPSKGFHCTHQGISPGWADVYGNALACQWLDITNVAPGTYTLEVEIDRSGILLDADRTNNAWSTPVSF